MVFDGLGCARTHTHADFMDKGNFKKLYAPALKNKAAHISDPSILANISVENKNYLICKDPFIYKFFSHNKSYIAG